ncbi:UDP-N-acetylmuramate dehydrogenase [Metabacillus malikii]|uniref:UDP-N-acetylenolpyruvoylglucosamine reductase n=1 Tax=Metabacillus malikii TaxID=1504265 RepID=A0ABT9ZG64_9BACI|nr:UDP-N-acetylmuramate dehydrogenase [Metabacillus malikii]MDQ0231268.1 UDP-N-acetylmuramate dehydrogenase [Metabacillus malikii]
MSTLYQELLDANIGKVLKNEPLAKHTTIKIGGPAELFIEPNSKKDLITVLQLINKHKKNWRVIGRGSNMLISDEGINGVVIKLGLELDYYELDGESLRVGAACSVIKLATLISKQGYSGLEFSSGIPGSIGGAIYMNAGAHGSDMSKILEKAQILFEDGSIEWLSKDELEFSYRTSILQEKRPGICLEAVLRLKKGKKEEIVAVMQRNKHYRRETQPWNYPCAGSIFRNPLPFYAGKLIEEAGLKGYKKGGAKVSEMHGNFIVNSGDATANDVVQLINDIKSTIKEKYNISLETEVEIIGLN